MMNFILTICIVTILLILVNKLYKTKNGDSFAKSVGKEIRKIKDDFNSGFNDNEPKKTNP